MSQKITDSLQKLGLTPNEAEIYLTLVDLGPCFVAPIIQETKKHRQVVYNALETLERKQLVYATTKNGKHWYNITNPDFILDIVKEQEQIATSVIKNILERQKFVEESSEMMYGEQAFKRSVAEFSKYSIENKEYLVINSIPIDYREMIRGNPAYQESMQKSAKSPEARIQIIVFEELAEELKDPEIADIYLGNPFETRILSGVPRPPEVIWVTGDYAYIRTKMSEPVIVKIHSPNLSDQYRKYFYKLWDLSKPHKAS